MFFAQKIKSVFIALALVLITDKSCHAMTKDEVKTPDTQLTVATASKLVQPFVYSGLFERQLETEAKNATILDGCEYYASLTALGCCLFCCAAPTAGSIAGNFASLIVRSKTIIDMSSTMGSLLALTPLYPSIRHLNKEALTKLLRRTCSVFIDQNNFTAISEYLFMLKFWNMQEKHCAAALSFQEQMTVISDYMRKINLNCAIEYAIEFSSKTGEPTIFGTATWHKHKQLQTRQQQILLQV